MRVLLFVLLLSIAAPAFADAVKPDAPLNVKLEQPWARPGVKGGELAIYLILENHTGKDLVLRDLSTPAAEMAMVHENISQGGVVKMRMIEDLKIPAGTSVDFTPKEKHIMLTGLAHDIRLGDRITLNFVFDQGNAKIDVPVQMGPAYTNN